MRRLPDPVRLFLLRERLLLWQATLCILFLRQQLGDLGHLIGRGGLLSVMLVLTLLPALLVLCDPLIIEKDWKKPGRKIREHYGVRRHQFHERAERIRELGNRRKSDQDFEGQEVRK